MRSIRVGVAAVALVCAGASAGLAQSEAELTRCHNAGSTIDIVQCLAGMTKAADRRLNANYQKTLKIVDPSGLPAARAAERAWLEYRKQRCDYLSAGPGTIGQVVGADCFARMTKARADELGEDSKGLGPG